MMKKPRPERAQQACGPESCFALSGLDGYSFASDPPGVARGFLVSAPAGHNKKRNSKTRARRHSIPHNKNSRLQIVPPARLTPTLHRPCCQPPSAAASVAAPLLRSQTMRQSILRNPIGLAALVALATTTAGCGQAAAIKADHTTGSPITRVEVVKPGRTTIRRSTEEPGRIEAYEVTPIYAKVSGYVQKWNTDIGTKVVKGQVLAVVSVPELDAEVEQKMATVEETEAKLAQAKASEEVAQANLASAQAKLTEVQAGTKRADADLARWQSEFKRVEQLHNERALTGSLLDETRSKLRSSESSREEVYAQVKTAEVAVRQVQA